MSLTRNYRNWLRFGDTVSEVNTPSGRDLPETGMSAKDSREAARKAS